MTLAFTQQEEQKAQRMLEDLVRALRIVPGGGKIEEDYWSYIYHKLRGAPTSGWSNLPMRDFNYGGLGVEIKLLRRNNPVGDQGRRLMHPAATRTIEFDQAAGAEACKKVVLEQFGRQISEFRKRVAEEFEDAPPTIRWGIFLWSPTLDNFLYFEEEMIEPEPANYTAEFVDRQHRGNPTRSLWIYEKDTEVKRYSVTMPERGAKIQPYFDVPTKGKGAHLFKIPVLISVS